MPDDWLFALNSRLIHCSITAYGKHGPLTDKPPIEDLGPDVIKLEPLEGDVSRPIGRTYCFKRSTLTRTWESG